MGPVSRPDRRCRKWAGVLPAVLLAPLVALGPLAAPAAPAASAASAAPEPSTGDPTAEEPAAPYRIEPFRPRADDPPGLVRAWNAWQGGERRRYAVVVERFCECLPRPPVRAEVRGPRVVSVTYEGRDRELARAGYTVDRLYRLLSTAHRRADAVETRFERGVPVSIYVDWDRRLADEETVLSIDLADADRPEPFRYAVTPFRPRASDPAVLRRNWGRWSVDGRPRVEHYVTVVRRQAGEGTFPTVNTEVEGGVVRDVSVLRTGEPLARGWEVEQLYRLLRRAYDGAHRVDVRWDSTGVPRRIAVDWVRDAVDDETLIRVRLGSVLEAPS